MARGYDYQDRLCAYCQQPLQDQDQTLCEACEVELHCSEDCQTCAYYSESDYGGCVHAGSDGVCYLNS